MSDTDFPATPALTAWAEAHPYGKQRDNARTHLWFPTETPHVTLQTISVGGNDIWADPEHPTVDVHLGNHIQIGGYLADMEAYFAAVVDAIRVARWQADQIAEQQAEAPS